MKVNGEDRGKGTGGGDAWVGARSETGAAGEYVMDRVTVRGRDIKGSGRGRCQRGVCGGGLERRPRA